MANQPIQIEYNDELQSLEELLAGVSRGGDFCASGSIDSPMPNLLVDGIGRIAFPILPPQANALISTAERAPYGRGEETLVDTNVRNVWQIRPERFRLGGKAWPAILENIVRSVARGLGVLDSSTVTAELYKLLIYDAGSFFKAHRDTEKAEGMFGTLVVALPAVHEGGELVVRHEGRESTIDLAFREDEDDLAAKLKFAAFYADCEHELRPVRTGYRVALIYNLLRSAVPKRGKGTQAGAKERALDPAASQESDELRPVELRPTAEAVAARLEAWRCDPAGATKIVYLLEHQYTPAGLGFDALKNRDAAVAQVFALAGARARCAVHLALVHIQERGAADVFMEYRGYGRSGWIQIQEIEDATDKDFEIIEPFESRRFVDNWIDSRGRAVKLGEIPLLAGELLPARGLENEPPDEQRVQEATGNQGGTYERAYHRAAIVLWPEERTVDVLLQGGVGPSLPRLLGLARKAADKAIAGGERDAARSEGKDLAERMIAVWESSPRDRYLREEESSRHRRDMLEALLTLGHADLLERFLESVVAVEFDGSEVNELAACASVLSEKALGEAMTTVIDQNAPFERPAILELVAALVRTLRSDDGVRKPNALRRIATTVIDSFAPEDAKKREAREVAMMHRRRWRAKSSGPIDSTVAAGFLSALGAFASRPLLERAARAIIANAEMFAPEATLVPALKSLAKEPAPGAAARSTQGSLWRHATESLLARSEFAPEPPTSWSQDVTIHCRCANCRALQEFARDPERTEIRFSVRADLRAHLHGTIERNQLDMTHVTERRGSPYTLVCTKTLERYRKRVEQHQADLGALRSLLEVAELSGKGMRSLVVRAREAISRTDGGATRN